MPTRNGLWQQNTSPHLEVNRGVEEVLRILLQRFQWRCARPKGEDISGCPRGPASLRRRARQP
jgi:hypothetical protein